MKRHQILETEETKSMELEAMNGALLLTYRFKQRRERVRRLREELADSVSNPWLVSCYAINQFGVFFWFNITLVPELDH